MRETKPKKIATSMTVQEPHARTYVRWSVERLRMAERAADAGHLRYAAEFCEALFGDDRAAAVLHTRVMSLLGLPVGFEESFAGDGRKRSRAARALEHEEDWWTIAPTNSLALTAKWGFVLGVGVASTPWIQRRDREVPQLTPWHPLHVRYDFDKRRWTTETASGTEEIAGDAGRGAGGRWAMFLPYGPRRPWSHGMWRGMGRWYLLKQYAIDDWGRHSESAAIRVATSGLTAASAEMSGTSREARQQLAADIYDAAKDASIVLPHGFDLKLVEATANTRDIYEAQVNAANLAYAIQALGHNLTTEVSGQGSFAAGKVGDSVRQDYKRFDNEALSNFAHDELLERWAVNNFGDAALALWPKWPVEPPRDKKAYADTAFQVANAVNIFTAAGAPVDMRALCERFDIPLISKAEEQRMKE